MTLGGGDCGFYPVVGAEGVKDSVSKSQTGCALSKCFDYSQEPALWQERTTRSHIF